MCICARRKNIKEIFCFGQAYYMTVRIVQSLRSPRSAWPNYDFRQGQTCSPLNSLIFVSETCAVFCLLATETYPQVGSVCGGVKPNAQLRKVLRL
jgi:hypothetical protein